MNDLFLLLYGLVNRFLDALVLLLFGFFGARHGRAAHLLRYALMEFRLFGILFLFVFLPRKLLLDRALDALFVLVLFLVILLFCL